MSMGWTRHHSLTSGPAARRARRGAAAVEFAIVAAPLFLFIFASIEFNRALMAVQSLEEAARSGCRMAILPGGTPERVQAAVAEVLSPAGISTSSTGIQPLNPTTADRWSPITVTVTASFADMTWLPLPGYLGERTYLAACTLPKEYPPQSE